jgi:hypothetical protein
VRFRNRSSRSRTRSIRCPGSGCGVLFERKLAGGLAVSCEGGPLGSLMVPLAWTDRGPAAADAPLASWPWAADIVTAWDRISALPQAP